MHTGVTFVYSPALYPQSPLENKDVFTHGVLAETKTRNGERIIKVKDEKGEWEGFAEETKIENAQVGERVRAYGTILAQPDGKLALSIRWAKKVGEEEYAFCQKETHNEWNNLVQQHATLNVLIPYKAPAPKIISHTLNSIPAKAEPSEFISAAEFKVEREYL